MTKALRRQQHKANAAEAVEANWPRASKLFLEVLADLGPELEGLNQFEKDWALAAEWAYRLDNAHEFDNALAEAFDGIVCHFAALFVIGVMRLAMKNVKKKKRTLERVTTRLADPDIAPLLARRLKRRQKRLKRAIRRAG